MVYTSCCSWIIKQPRLVTTDWNTSPIQVPLLPLLKAQTSCKHRDHGWPGRVFTLYPLELADVEVAFLLQFFQLYLDVGFLLLQRGCPQLQYLVLFIELRHWQTATPRPSNTQSDHKPPHYTTTVSWPFFPGPPGWASARRELLDFMVQGKINRGRHTDHLAGCHSIRTNQCPPPPSAFFYSPDALPAAQPTVSKHWRQLVHSD